MIFSLMTMTLALADDGEKILSGFDPSRDVISEKYFAGPYLIYDCEEKHWVCVMEDDFKECQKKRDEDKNNKKEILGCAPLGSFPTKKSCFQRQLFLTGQNHGTRFCISDEWKEKDVKF